MAPQLFSETADFGLLRVELLLAYCEPMRAGDLSLLHSEGVRPGLGRVLRGTDARGGAARAGRSA